MSIYSDKLPQVNEITLDLRRVFGDGYLKIIPQEGPQTTFMSCMAGNSEEDETDEEFYLVFYGGAK